jgi:hypothetical protein
VSTPAWHYREAERYVREAAGAYARANDYATRATSDGDLSVADAAFADAWTRHEFEVAGFYNDAALVHATLANAGATIEAANDGSGGHIVMRPQRADPDLGEHAYPGTEWGRAFYGDLHLETGDPS